MRRMVLMLGAESSATRVSLTALMERVHSDGGIPPGRKCFVLMEHCQPSGLIPIDLYFDHTSLVWANETMDSYIRSGVGYSPFSIGQNSSVADHCIVGFNKV